MVLVMVLVAHLSVVGLAVSRVDRSECAKPRRTCLILHCHTCFDTHHVGPVACCSCRTDRQIEGLQLQSCLFILL